MPTRHAAGIRIWLLLMAAAASLPVYLFYGYLIFRFSQQQQEASAQSLVERAQGAAETVNRRLHALVGYADAIRASEAAQQNDVPRLYQLSRRLVEHSTELVAISLIAADGHLVFLTSLPLGQSAVVPAQADNVRRVLESGQTLLSGPFKSPVSERMVASLSTPLVQHGQVAYCLRLVMSTDSLNRLLADQHLPDNWTAALVDRNGHILARSTEAGHYVGQSATPTLVRALQVGQTGVFETTNLEGRTTSTTIQSISGWDWSFAAGMPTAALQAPMHRALTQYAALGLLSLLAGALAAYAVAGVVTRQVAGLERSAVDMLSQATMVPAVAADADESARAQRRQTQGRATARRPMHVSALLMALALAAALPLLLLSAYTVNRQAQAQRNQVLHDLVLRNQAQATEYARTLDRFRSALENMVSADPALAQDLSKLYPYAQRLVQQTSFARAIELCDSADHCMFSTAQPIDRAGGKALNSEALKPVFNAGKVNVTGAYPSRPDGANVAAVQLPWWLQGRVAYVLRLVIDAQQLNQVLAAQNLPPSWTSAILDRDGRYVALRESAQRRRDEIPPHLLPASWRQQAGVVFDSSTRDGVDMQSVVSEVPGWDWHVLNGVPSAELNGPLRQAMVRLALVALFFIGLGAWMAQGLAARITRHIQSVLAAAQADGQAAPASAGPVEELNRLSRTLDALHSRMQSTNRDLKRQHDKFAALLHNASDGLHIVDAHGNLIEASDAFCAMLGYTRVELMGLNIRRWKSDWTDLDDEQLRARIEERASQAKFEGRYRCRDGSTLEVDVTVAALTLDAQPAYFFSARDNTERKQAQASIEQINAQLERRVEERTRELEKSNAELEDFAYIASHDLKEPLRALHNYATFLQEDYDDKLDAQGRTYVARIQGLVKREIDLIDRLLTYSRVKAADWPVAPVKLDQVLDQVLQDLQPLLAQRQVSVIRAGSLPELVCNDSAIGEVFQNLISNAAKYNDKPERWIRIGCSTDSTPTLYVWDNGIGIPAQHLKSVFRIFKRLHGRDHFGGGTGAGLTIVKKIIERHGGTIWADSVVGVGTRFSFTLPQASPQAGAAAASPGPG